MKVVLTLLVVAVFIFFFYQGKTSISPAKKITNNKISRSGTSAPANQSVEVTEAPASPETLSASPHPSPTTSSSVRPTPTPTATTLFGVFGGIAMSALGRVPSSTPTPVPIRIYNLYSISNVYSATINFKTTASAISQIYFGESAAYGDQSDTSSFAIDHSHTLNLQSGREYHYKIRLADSGYRTILFSDDYTLRTQEAKTYRLTLVSINVIKDGNSRGPGTIRLYMKISDPERAYGCCGFLDSFSANDGQTVTLNEVFGGGAARHGPLITASLDPNSTASPAMLSFSFDAPLTGPNQNYTRSYTSSEKSGLKFSATFRIEIF